MREITIEVDGLRYSAIEAGPSEGPLVLCLHGFPDTSGTWVHQLRALAERGYRAVAPMLRGYEPATVKAGRGYFPGDLAQDALGWLDGLGAERGHLLAHDWGTVAAYGAAAMAPERIRSLTALAVPPAGRLLAALPARPLQAVRSRYMLFFQLRGLSDWWLAYRDGGAIRRYWARWSPGWQAPEAVLGPAVEALGNPAVRRAALGYYRDLFRVADPRWREGLELLQRPIRVPSQILMGHRDQAISPSLLDVTVREEDFPAGVSVGVIHGTGHWLHLEAPEAVNGRILAFLERTQRN